MILWSKVNSDGTLLDALADDGVKVTGAFSMYCFSDTIISSNSLPISIWQHSQLLGDSVPAIVALTKVALFCMFIIVVRTSWRSSCLFMTAHQTLTMNFKLNSYCSLL